MTPFTRLMLAYGTTGWRILGVSVLHSTYKSKNFAVSSSVYKVGRVIKIATDFHSVYSAFYGSEYRANTYYRFVSNCMARTSWIAM